MPLKGGLAHPMRLIARYADGAGAGRRARAGRARAAGGQYQIAADGYAGVQDRLVVDGYEGEQGRIQLSLDQEAVPETPPRLTGFGMAAVGFRLTASVQPGRTYQLLAADGGGPWVLVTQFTSPGAEFNYLDPVPPGRPVRLYRIVGP